MPRATRPVARVSVCVVCSGGLQQLAVLVCTPHAVIAATVHTACSYYCWCVYSKQLWSASSSKLLTRTINTCQLTIAFPVAAVTAIELKVLSVCHINAVQAAAQGFRTQ
eukprot:20663-Heterococcus_DN1.PRE.6